MAEGRSNTALIVAVLLLAAGLIAVFVLWQQEESEGLDIDIGSADGTWRSDVGSTAVRDMPPGIRFTEGEAVG